MGSIPILGIEFEGWGLALGQVEAQVALEQGLHEQGDEENEHVGLDPLDLLEEQGGG